MKLTTIYSLMAAAAAGLGLWSCSADNLGVSEPDNRPALGETVRLTVAVSRDPSAATRTALTENAGNLDCVWTEGDKLLVTDASGVRRGVLEIAGGVGEAEGTFTGEVSIEGLSTEEKTSLNFLYLGTSLNATVSATDDFNGWNDSEKKYTADYTEQNSTLASLTDKDFLTVSENVNLSAKGDGKEEVYVANTLQMVRRISFAKFQLRLPKGVTLGSGAKVTVTGTGLNSLAMASFADNVVKMAYSQALEESADAQSNTGISTSPATRYDVTGGASTSTGGTLLPSPAKPVKVNVSEEGYNKDNNIYSLYMVLLPNGLTGDDAKFDLAFEVKASDGSTYKGTYAVTKGIVEGKYYHKHTVTADDGTTKSEDIVIDMDDADLVGPVFEVNGKTFRFTRANLRYNIEKSEWSLFDNQYDFLCKSGWHDQNGRKIDKIARKTSLPDEATVIDLFGFGATGLKDEGKSTATEVRARAPQYYLEYPDWDTNGFSPSPTTEGKKYPSNDSKSNNYVLNQGYTGSYLEHGINGTVYDWGAAYGNGLSSLFFTLSSSDWRSLASKYYMIGATITDADNSANGSKGIYGCMIFNVENPSDARNFFLDDNGNKSVNYLAKSFPSRPEFKSDSGQGNPVNNTSSGFSYTTLKMTKAEFAELEKEGHFVFLPEAGHRASSSYTKTSGYYWTSTNGQAWDARYFRFYGGTSETKFFCMDKMTKWYGCAVRLVKEVVVPSAQ